ncbi:hypothetical protein BGZ82_002926 [Podila clonocystis]|nr:hypothetical protein BGZ82_002926 [Podila clonocystis]
MSKFHKGQKSNGYVNIAKMDNSKLLLREAIGAVLLIVFYTGVITNLFFTDVSTGLSVFSITLSDESSPSMLRAQEN